MRRLKEVRGRGLGVWKENPQGIALTKTLHRGLKIHELRERVET